MWEFLLRWNLGKEKQHVNGNQVNKKNKNSIPSKNELFIFCLIGNSSSGKKDKCHTGNKSESISYNY